ncbi:MAG: hypothetical protein JW882_18020, partial [Deltaproteobacteria bacterium]|nr:hypothetical protein [Deltaproteobacteria bacterium]
NNLILDWLPEEPIFSVDTFTNYTSSDYNGFCPNPRAPYSYAWNSPSFEIMKDYDNPQKNRKFTDLTQFQKATKQDTHSMLIDFSIFQNVKAPDYKSPTQVYYEVKPSDFQLVEGASAIDAGCVIPNVNDNFTGKAPDLGALEAGMPLPIYGPRK